MHPRLFMVFVFCALAGCNQHPPRDCQLGADVLVEVRSPLNDSTTRAISLAGGDSIRGSFKPIGALRVDAVAVQIGNSGGTADGEVQMKLCQDGLCVNGRASLRGSKDNDYLEIRLQPTLPVVFERGPVSFELTRLAGAGDMAVWVYPGFGSETELQVQGGKSPETLNLMLRQY